MPILVVCPSCAKRLQVKDDQAGIRVRCPACQFVLTVPATAPQTPAPAPPPPPPPSPAPTCDEPFAFGGAGGRAAGEQSFDDEPESEPERPRTEGRSGRRRPTGPAGWSGFASGCGLVKRGLWIELVGVLLLFAIVEITLFLLLSKEKPLLQRLGPFAFLAFFLPLLAGTLCITIGRLRMVSLPSGTGAAGILLGATVLSIIRMVGLLVATVFIVLAGFEWRNFGVGGDYLDWAAGAYVVALTAGLVAEETMITGMAVAGGAIPSRRLLRQAGRVGFVIQLLGLLYVGLVALVYFGNLADNMVQPNPPPRAGAGPQPAGGVTPEEKLTFYMVVCFVVLGIQIAYTYLHYSLYAAGQAGASGHERAR